jgi:hypothetical protein
MVAETFSNKQHAVSCDLRDRDGAWYPCVRSDSCRAHEQLHYYVQPPFTSVPMCAALENCDRVTRHLEEVVKWREKFLKLRRSEVVHMLGLQSERGQSSDEGDSDSDEDSGGEGGGGKRGAPRVADEQIREALRAFLHKPNAQVRWNSAFTSSLPWPFLCL